MLVTIIWEKSEGEPALVTARYVPYACSETVIELKRSVHNQFRRPGVLTIYKNHPVGNFRHKHKTIKCEVAGVGITIKYIHISWRDLKEQKNSITSYYSPYFLKLSKWNGVNHLIFQLEFPVFPCKW